MPLSERDIALCGQCRAAIVWTLTDAGKRMPVNAEPAPDGNQAVYKDAEGITHSRALNSTTAPELRPHEWRAKPHFASCTAPPRPRQPRRTPQTVRRTPWRPR